MPPLPKRKNGKFAGKKLAKFFEKNKTLQKAKNLAKILPKKIGSVLSKFQNVNFKLMANNRLTTMFSTKK